LEEIEAVLASFPRITAAAAAVKVLGEGAERSEHLVAYYTGPPGTPETKVKDFLANHLPPYMVPTALVQIKRIPLSLSGKVNRRALPLPALSAASLAPPRTPLERQLTDIWSSVLGLDRNLFGIRDNFFSLGGDSITLLLVLRRLRKDLSLTITLKEARELSTIAALAEALVDKLAQSTTKTQDPLQVRKSRLRSPHSPCLDAFSDYLYPSESSF
jgi:acyl carrier protein